MWWSGLSHRGDNVASRAAGSHRGASRINPLIFCIAWCRSWSLGRVGASSRNPVDQAPFRLDHGACSLQSRLTWRSSNSIRPPVMVVVISQLMCFELLGECGLKSAIDRDCPSFAGPLARIMGWCPTMTCSTKRQPPATLGSRRFDRRVDRLSMAVTTAVPCTKLWNLVYSRGDYKLNEGFDHRCQFRPVS